MAILNETIPFPVWAAAVSSVALVAATVLARHFKAKRQIGVVVGIALLTAGSLIGPPLLAAIAGSPDRPDAAAADQIDAERHALERRRAELSAVALAPGSALACLDALAGVPVETACERSVFASPASTAAAVAYAVAQLRLLADGAAFARRQSDPGYLARLAELRLAAENDAYGIYAHVLATRDGCTPERCDAFALVQNPSTLKLHLRQRLYASMIARHRGQWRAENEPSASVRLMAAPASTPSTTGATRERPPSSLWFASAAVSVASAGTAATARADDASAATARPSESPAGASDEPAATGAREVVPPAASVLTNLEYPSAASIPPISIMAEEPKLPAEPVPSTAPVPPSRPQ